MFAVRKYRSELNRLIGQWVEFRDLVQTHLGDEATTQLVERRFLDLKGIIAERLARLGEAMPPHHGPESIQTQRGMLEFMNAVPSLRDGGPPTAQKRDEFERTWQRYYLHLNQLKGLKPAGGKAAAHRAPIVEAPRHRHPGADRFFSNWFVKFVLVVAVLSGAVYVLSRVLPWERMGLGPKLAGLPGAAVDAGGRLVDGAGRMGGFVGGLRNFFDPVVAQYGPEATVIMCTVLLLAFGYWAFIRIR